MPAIWESLKSFVEKKSTKCSQNGWKVPEVTDVWMSIDAKMVSKSTDSPSFLFLPFPSNSLPFLSLIKTIYCIKKLKILYYLCHLTNLTITLR